MIEGPTVQHSGSWGREEISDFKLFSQNLKFKEKSTVQWNVYRVKMLYSHFAAKQQVFSLSLTEWAPVLQLLQ